MADLGFCFEGSLHGVEGALMILPGVLEFLLLLLDAAIDFLSDLAELELAAQHFVLLLFEGGFGFLESGLKLILLSLQALPGLLDFVNVAATFADLVQQVFHLVGEILVFATHCLQLFLTFLVGT